MHVFSYNKKMCIKEIKSTQKNKRGMNHKSGADTLLINVDSALTTHSPSN